MNEDNDDENLIPNNNSFLQYSQWLSSISSSDAALLASTAEFQTFLLAMKRLEVRHIGILNHNNMKVSEKFLQNQADTDILNRVFDCLNSVELVHAARTCSRFFRLAKQNAHNRTKLMTFQLSNSLQLLRAKEQLEGAAVDRLFVPVPTLLLNRRLIVQFTGTPVYNGVYSCTGCNGNGYVFSKHSLDDDHTKCIIEKRFSGSTLLWYMGMIEHGDEERFHFWAPLLSTGDARPELHLYPSQTSVLQRDNPERGWEALLTAPNRDPPVVELLDG